MSTTVHIVSDVFDDQGVETSYIRNLNAEGWIKNAFTVTTRAESTTARVSGTGSVVNLSKASVTLADGASAIINGSELQISVGANSQTVVNGQFLSIADASGATVTANSNTKLTYDDFLSIDENEDGKISTPIGPQTLSSLCISGLNYTIGSFTQSEVNGEEVKQLAASDSSADKEGMGLRVVPRVTLVKVSANGHLTLFANHIDDKTSLKHNRGEIRALNYGLFTFAMNRQALPMRGQRCMQ